MSNTASSPDQSGMTTNEQARPSEDEHQSRIDEVKREIAVLVKEFENLNETSPESDVRRELISELREANQNLVHAAFGAQDMQAKAEAIIQRQSEFLSMLAHELRNPLAPITMACEMLGTITDAHKLLPRLHQIMARQLTHMRKIIDELMDAARITSGKITLNQRPLALAEIMTCAVETSQPLIARRQQKLDLELPAQPVFVDGDLTRLTQVFSNLLVNASKFSPEHQHITVRAQLLDDTVSISVIDNGDGIDAESLPLVFELFVQSDHSLDRARGGLGIGLSLARAIVTLHGGTITVASAGTNQGSEFTVLLPVIEHRPAVTEKSPAAVPTRTCRILLIDDYPDINETLAALLRMHGHTVSTAINGITGLALAQGQEFDVVVSDIGLPGMDGYEVARQLRQNNPARTPYLIAVSGYDQPANRKLAQQAGFDHYLIKPIAFESVFELIQNSLVREINIKGHSDAY